LQIIVRDNNIDQALKALKRRCSGKHLPRDEAPGHYEKPSEKRARERPRRSAATASFRGSGCSAKGSCRADGSAFPAKVRGRPVAAFLLFRPHHFAGAHSWHTDISIVTCDRPLWRRRSSFLISSAEQGTGLTSDTINPR